MRCAGKILTTAFDHYLHGTPIELQEPEKPKTRSASYKTISVRKRITGWTDRMHAVVPEVELYIGSGSAQRHGGWEWRADGTCAKINREFQIAVTQLTASMLLNMESWDQWMGEAKPRYTKKGEHTANCVRRPGARSVVCFSR